MKDLTAEQIGAPRMMMMEVPQDKLEEMREAIHSRIFRPIPEDSWLQKRIKGWMINYLKNHESGRIRFDVIHNMKTGIVHRILKFVAKRMKQYLIKDWTDIPAKWWNNHLRMFEYSFEKGTDEMWTRMYWEQGKNGKLKAFKTPKEFLTHLRDSKPMPWGYNISYHHRLLIPRLWISYVMEDTVDREWLNMSIMRLTHEMMEHYGVSEEERKKVPRPGEFPVYTSVTADNPEYFVKNLGKKVWGPNEGKFR